MAQQDPWSGFDTVAPNGAQADPWSGFDSATAVAEPPSFDTALTPAEESRFKVWKARYAPKDSGEDYDLRGAFKEGLKPDPKSGHWPDTYKKPNHPTFSNESKYAEFGKPGRWDGETFVADPGVSEKPGASDYSFDPLAGVEDVVRGAEVGGGRALQFAGETGRRVYNAIRDSFGTDKTEAEKKREIGRAGKPGKALIEQGLTHPEPTTLPGKILEGIGGVVPLLGASALNPALGAVAIGAVAGASIEDRYDQVKAQTGSHVKAAEAALTEVPLQALYLAPLGRIMTGATEGASLLRRALDGAITGVVGPGSARVLGEVIGEQISEEDKADLADALKRGLKAGGEEAMVQGPVFALLGAIAGREKTSHKVTKEVTAEKAPEISASKEVEGVVSRPEAPPVLGPEGVQAGDGGGQSVVATPGETQLPRPLAENQPAAPATKELKAGPTAESAIIPPETGAPPKISQDAPEPSVASEPRLEPIVEPAKPQEADGPEQSPTSTKNRVVEAERAERGEAPLEQAARREFGESWEMAGKALEEDPSLADRLVKGESVSGVSRDVQDAALTRAKIPVRKEYARVREALIKAQESGDEGAAKALGPQKESLRARLDEMDAATKAFGSETGRALAIRRLEANEDFSLASVESELRVAAGGRKLTASEEAIAKQHSDRILAAENKIAEIEARLDLERTEKTLRANPTRRTKVLAFLDAQAEEARTRLKSKLSRAGGGAAIDPGDIADVARIAASHLAHGIDATARLVQDFGEAIKPHLDAIMEQARTIYTSASKQDAAERGRVTRSVNFTEKLKAKTEAGDFEPAPKKEPLPITPEWLKAKTEREAAVREYNRRLQDFRHKNRTTAKKALDTASELAIDLPRAIKSSWDFSAVLRQGGWRAMGHPIEAAKILPEMFQATFSERKALEIDVKLRNRPLAGVGEKAKLELTRHGDDLGKHEEAIRSRWSDKIPGIKASNRAFVTFLNVQRATAFDAMYEALPASERSPEAAKALANYINVATGRGDPGKAAPFMQAAGKILWAPRLLLSRFQLLSGQPMYRGTAATRKAIAGDYARALTGLAAVYALGKLAGGTIETDPRSADGGKIRMPRGSNTHGYTYADGTPVDDSGPGDTRVDPGMGLFQVTRLLSTLATGERKNAAGQLRPTREPLFTDGKGPRYGESDTTDVIKTFLRTKLTPALGTAVDIATGKNVVGENVTPGSLAKDQLPLTFQDIYDTMVEQGMEKGAALEILNIFGMGVSTYDTKKKK